MCQVSDLVNAGIVPAHCVGVTDEEALRNSWLHSRQLNQTLERAKSSQDALRCAVSESLKACPGRAADSTQEEVLLAQLTDEIKALEEKRAAVEREMALILRLEPDPFV